MSTDELLEAARNFVACKWDEAGGASILDALNSASMLGDGARVWPAYEQLERVVVPAVAAYNRLGDSLVSGAQVDGAELGQLARIAAKCISLQAWLEQPGRRHAEVLRAFDVAILKARDSRAA